MSGHAIPSTRHASKTSRGLLVLRSVSSLVLAGAMLPVLADTALAAPGIITTVAGGGSSGLGDGGLATNAQLSTPFGVAVDGAGSFYIANFNDSRIRKVDATGVITTIAGTATPGYSGDGGPAVSAQLKRTTGVAVDRAGSVFVADRDNQRIRKIDTSGIITTIAGTGTAGFSGDGGPATSAQLNFPNGVGVDGAGNVYVGDSGNSRVRKIDTSGVITTVAGTGVPGYSGNGGPATSAQLNSPNQVAFDSGGNLYIADYFNGAIRKVDPAGTISSVAGGGVLGYSGDGGPATSARLNQPAGVAVDAFGNIYISDSNNHRVRMVDASGTITTIAGTGTPGYSGDNGLSTNADLNLPMGIAHDGIGNVYVAVANNQRIRKVTVAPGVAVPASVGAASDSCTAGTNVVTGWFGSAYSSLRTMSVGSTTSVCAVVESGGVHAGGRLSITTGLPALPTTDNNQPACANPGYAGDYQLIRDVSALGRQLKIEVKVRPSATAPNEVWVCVLADTTAKRIVVPIGLGGVGVPTFTADPATEHSPAYSVTPPLAGQNSSSCQQDGGESGRVLNATVATMPAWVYTRQVSATRTEVCVRLGTAGGDGGRLTVDSEDALTIPAITDFSSDRSPCPQQVVDDAGPPAYSLYVSDPGSLPAWACVNVSGTAVRVKLDPGSGGVNPAVVTFTRDS